MSTRDNRKPESSDRTDSQHPPDLSHAGLGEEKKRPDMMSKKQIEQLGAEKGFPEVAADRAYEPGQPGPQPYGDPHKRPSIGGGRRGKLLDQKAKEQQED